MTVPLAFLLDPGDTRAAIGIEAPRLLLCPKTEASMCATACPPERHRARWASLPGAGARRLSYPSPRPYSRPTGRTFWLVDREVVRVHVRLIAPAVLVDVAPQDDGLSSPAAQRVALLNPSAAVSRLLEERRER